MDGRVKGLGVVGARTGIYLREEIVIEAPSRALLLILQN